MTISKPPARMTPAQRAERFIGKGSDFTIITPLCLSCKWYAYSPGNAPTCLAFPKGIPGEILRNIFDHHKPYPGDNGIQYIALAPASPKKGK